MRYVINWKYFHDKAIDPNPSMGGQFSVLAGDLHVAAELAAIDIFAELDKVQAMVPPSMTAEFSIHDPADMACLVWAELDMLGQFINGKPEKV